MSRGPVTAYIALGSNLGDRRAVIESAIAALEGRPAIDVTKRSSIIETEPVGAPGQGPFLNAAIAVQTMLRPQPLLETCLLIEAWHGRRRDAEAAGPRWTARILDLDLLLYGDEVIREDRLTVPHPRLHERLFVLEPLAEIAGDVLHPVLGRSIEWLREARRRERRGERPPAP